MSNRTISLWIIILLTLLLAACHTEQGAPSQAVTVQPGFGQTVDNSPTIKPPAPTAVTPTRLPTMALSMTPAPSKNPTPTTPNLPTATPWALGNLGPIAYFSSNYPDNIGLISTNGSDDQQLFTHPERNNGIAFTAGFSWSPDGMLLAYSSELWNDIWVYSLKDGQTHNLTNLDGKFETSPDWSPDGKKIAFAGDIDEGWGIYIMNVDGSKISLLVKCPMICRDPDWSPDGDYIVYQTQTAEERYDIIIMRANGSEMKSLTHNAVNLYPVWSPDGKSIAFIRSADFTTNDQPYIYRMNPDGTELKALTNDTFRPRQFSWSPDGRFIAFDSFHSGAVAALMILDVQSGVVKELASYGHYAPEWSPLYVTDITDKDIKSLDDCTAGWTKLQASGKAVVSGNVGDSPNRVRSEPMKGDNIIGVIGPGTEVTLLEGPVCADGLVFWKVQSAVIPGGLGWTAEGDGINYWMLRRDIP